jgi:hypothetical protein
MKPAVRRFPMPRPRARRRWLAVGGLAVAAAAALLAIVGFGLKQTPTLTIGLGPTALPTVTHGPRLTALPRRLDLGTVKLGQTALVVFMIANIGDQPLQLTRAPYVEVVAGCCPPTPAIGQPVLNPGERTTLTMTFDLRADLGGPHSYEVHLPSNDPHQPDTTLLVLGFWVP